VLLVPRVGLTGAGVAMLASSLIGAGAAQAALRRTAVLAELPMGPGRPYVREVLRLGRVGIPLAATVLIKFAVLGVLSFAAARLGTGSAAVHGICVSLAGLMFTAAVAIGQAGVPLIAKHARDGDIRGIRATVGAGMWVAAVAIGVLGALLVVLRHEVVGVFTRDSGIQELVLRQLPWVLAAVLADALQAVTGFGRLGLRRTGSGVVLFGACYGALALAAVPVAETGGLGGLWAALVVANVLLIAGQGWLLRRDSGQLAPAVAAVSASG
jgi:MATE family multidrug resistance protein